MNVVTKDGRTLAYCEVGDQDGPLVIHNHGGPSSRLEARLFAYDPRWFVWTFLALTVLCSIALWNLLARPPPG